MDAMKLLSCLLVLFVGSQLQLGEGAQCMPRYPNTNNLCGAMCNGTHFDLSKAFDFPITIHDGKDISPYKFVWDPCHGYKCSDDSEGIDTAVCQEASQFSISIGQTRNPIWLTEDWKNTKENFFNWEVQYTFGANWRIAIFKFIVDHTVEKPRVRFISEHPGLQYNFEVRGKCIGQDTYDCQPHYQSRN